MYNSTIRMREKTCVSCGKPCYWFSKKRCVQCAKVEDFNAKHGQEQSEPDLADLIHELDALVSKWVRYSAVGKDGFAECWTCRKRFLPSELDAGHYISRSVMLLRFDADRNIRPQCRTENRAKYGMAIEFGKRLEEERQGITEILLEESRIVHRWSREELKSMILDFSTRIKQLK